MKNWQRNKMALQQSIHFVKFNQTGQLKTDNFGSAAVKQYITGHFQKLNICWFRDNMEQSLGYHLCIIESPITINCP